MSKLQSQIEKSLFHFGKFQKIPGNQYSKSITTNRLTKKERYLLYFDRGHGIFLF
jgi:hypothetical protein